MGDDGEPFGNEQDGYNKRNAGIKDIKTRPFQEMCDEFLAII